MKIQDNKVIKLDRTDRGSDALRMAKRTNNEVKIVLKDGEPVFDIDSLRSYLSKKINSTGDHQKQEAWDNVKEAEDPDVLEELYRSIINP